jgi:pyruvate dehydrogenase E2 component (dihydrolipoamide acetyltransferase)
MSEFRMPSLGADMEAGTLVEWLVKPGSPVKRGDIIAVVETQKGAIEIEVFEDGVFERALVDVGAKVPVGTPLAAIGAPGGKPAVAVPPAAEAAPPVAAGPVAPPRGPAAVPARPEVAPAEAPATPAPPAPLAAAAMAAGRVNATPVARRQAEAAGVPLEGITGTGPAGEIVLADIAARAGEAPTREVIAAAAPVPATGMRAAIAAAMAHSKRDIPHYYLAHTIDLTAAERFLSVQNGGREPADRLLLGTLLVKAVARATRKYPDFNGHFDDGVFQPGASVHVGVAVNIRGTGLVAPAIHDTDQLSLDALMAAMRDLVIRVRAGRFRASELSDPTITVSSLGERGVDTLYGVIYPTQVAIVGFGTPVMRPWVVDGLIGPRRIVSVTLAGDHRVTDGHRGALFLKAIEDQLLEPEGL